MTSSLAKILARNDAIAAGQPPPLTPPPRSNPPDSDRFCGLFDDEPDRGDSRQDTAEGLSPATAKGLTSTDGDASDRETALEERRPGGADRAHEPPDPLAPPAPAIPCPTCGALNWWQSVYGPELRCCGCEPPPLPAMAARRWTIRVLLDDEGRPLPGTATTPYATTWQRCGPDWTPLSAHPTPESAGRDGGDLGDAGDVLADFTDDGPELEQVVRIDWWELLSDDERREISHPTQTGRGRCPWCKRWTTHTEECREMRREWGRMQIGKHKGKLLEVVPGDYLTWALQFGAEGDRIGTSDDRRMWLEELQGREHGHEFRTPYWERLVEV